ncbi:MAG: NAD(P)-dependent oxidoreductase [Ilumatobacteraceae bacterium]
MRSADPRREDGRRDAPPLVAIGPSAAPSWMSDAVRAAGAQIVEPEEAEALIWGSPRNAALLRDTIDRAPQVTWVQLPFAGIEPLVDVLDHDRVWTCGKGVYAEPVAELALALTLAGMRGVGRYARAAQWEAPTGRNLIGADVTVLGGGGITEAFLRLLTPFDCRTTVVRRRVAEIEGADIVVGFDRYVEAIADADVVVLALALTPETEGLLSREEFTQMRRDAWVVNVARGRHIITEDLVWALDAEVIGGAALDVTDPEPLPGEHPLWRQPNCIITPHVGNTPEMAVELLSERITTNVQRFAAGAPLVGIVDVDLGY